MSGIKKNPKAATIMLTELDMVQEVVFSLRRDGRKIDHAFESAGSHLGLNRHLVRKLMRGEIGRIVPKKVKAIRAGYVAWLRADIEKQEKLLTANYARLRAIEENAHFQMVVSKSRECSSSTAAFCET